MCLHFDNQAFHQVKKDLVKLMRLHKITVTDIINAIVWDCFTFLSQIRNLGLQFVKSTCLQV